MRFIGLFVLASSLISGVAIGDEILAPNAATSERSDLVTDNVIIWRGDNTFEFTLAEPARSPSLSVWYESAPACQGFAISGIEVLADEEWVSAPSLYYGEKHFFRTEGKEIKAIRLGLGQNQRLRMRCQIHIVGEDVQLPVEIRMLAKVVFVGCGEEPSLSQCTVQLQRLDQEAAAPYTAEVTSANRAKLEKDGIYKIVGYLEVNGETGAEEFIVSSAEQVFP